MNDALIGVLSNAITGIIGAVIGAVSAVYFQRKSDQKATFDEMVIQVYMHLLDLKNILFNVIDKKMINEEKYQEMLLKFESESLHVVNILWRIKKFSELKDIMYVLYSQQYKSHAERYAAFEEMIYKLGSKVNPQFMNIINNIECDNYNCTGELN